MHRQTIVRLRSTQFFFKGHRGAFSKVTLKILKHGIILACGPTCGQLFTDGSCFSHSLNVI